MTGILMGDPKRIQSPKFMGRVKVVSNQNDVGNIPWNLYLLCKKQGTFKYLVKIKNVPWL